MAIKRLFSNSFCHSEGAKRPKNLAQGRLREESKRDSSPAGLRMTGSEGLRVTFIGS